MMIFVSYEILNNTMPRKSTRCQWMSPISFKHSFTVFCFISLYVVRVFSWSMSSFASSSYLPINTIKKILVWKITLTRVAQCRWTTARARGFSICTLWRNKCAIFVLFDRRTMEKKKESGHVEVSSLSFFASRALAVRQWRTDRRVRQNTEYDLFLY